MRRGLKLVAALGLVAAMAVPAMADVSLTGFYRARGYVTNAFDYAGGTILPSGNSTDTAAVAGAPTAKAKSYVDQRYRGKFAAGDENVKAVAFFEIDSQWGDSSATVARNQGGALQGDSINLETKNVYLWFKIPDTSVDFTVGLQNVTDSYAGTFMGAADVAGVVSNFKFEPVAVRLGYLVPFQPQRDRATSTTFYMAEAKISPTKDVKVGANMYFIRDGGQSFNPGGQAFAAGSGLFDNAAIPAGTTKIYMPGVDFAVNAGVAKVSGFVFGQFGDRTYFSGAAKTKISGYAGDLRADLNAGPAKVFVEGLYVSGADYDRNNDKYKGVVTMDDFKFNSGSSTYARTDMVFLFPAADSINTGSGLIYDANNLGLGVIHLAAGATMDVMPKTTAKLGVGYAAAAKKLSNNSNAAYFNFREKSDIGTEVNATLNYNVTKGLDTALTGAYVFLGSAYDRNKASTATMDPKNPYAVIAKVNYAF